MKRKYIILAIAAGSLCGIGAMYELGKLKTEKSEGPQNKPTKIASATSTVGEANLENPTANNPSTEAKSLATSSLKTKDVDHSGETFTKLIGTWSSNSDEAGVTPGDIEFHRANVVVLKPVGYAPVTGKYILKDQWLTMTMPGMGDSIVQVLVSDQTLTLTYENGTIQSFKKVL